MQHMDKMHYTWCTVLFKCSEGRWGYRECSFRKYSKNIEKELTHSRYVT